VFFPKLPQRSPDSPAVVLFTSGSEGVPKGVVLSHSNLLANIAQAAARVDFGPKDVIFNALPVFHSFGLTAGALLPILSGIKVFFYPSPLHYRIIPELVYDVNATMLFGTDTFLAGYAKYGHPYDFRSVRYVIAGAEKLKEGTRNLWFERFGIRVFEGYGVTETSPVLSVNTPIHFKSGTVGRLLPEVEAHLEEVPGIEEGGRLHVRGPNVMLGYLKVDQPGVLQPPQGGWHDTGDIVDIDAEGFVSIKGRAKRFAKIGGEMVSLAAVEEHLAKAFPEHAHAVVSVPDERKGEQLVLVTTHEGISRDVAQEVLQQAGLTELALPRRIHTITSMPLLGSGKTDYPAVQKLVEG
ncbi:MAG: AMP-binding protein, partial [Alphaproteobacteria bacterium]|nr:AMP-binding protein [Alphaproteobacteria bacterium]